MLSAKPRLFKTRIALSTGEITIQCISSYKVHCVIRWIMIHPVKSAIHLLNNRGLIKHYPIDKS